VGSYERELHRVIEDLAGQKFSCIVDVGCAEGYYAVGFAMRVPQASVLAFDTDPRARSLCLEMAQLNGVAERVQVGGLCDEQTLLSLPLGTRALVISDCEGYELALFSTRVAGALAQHTFLIEVHDYVDEELGEKLKRRFEPTHHLEIFESIDDRRKVNGYDNAALAPYDTSMRRRLLTERRAWIMQWFLLTPRVAG
jgi:ribosomal protein L11 methylase PrmA